MKNLKDMLNEMTEEEQIQYINKHLFGVEIYFIKNPSEKVQLAAVNRSGFIIKFINNPSEKVQLAAVKKDGAAIKFIENPSEEVQLESIRKNHYNIAFIKNPTPRVQLEIIKANSWAESYLNKLDESIFDKLEKSVFMFFPTFYHIQVSDDLKIKAIKHSYRNIVNFRFPKLSERVQKAIIDSLNNCSPTKDDIDFVLNRISYISDNVIDYALTKFKNIPSVKKELEQYKKYRHELLTNENCSDDFKKEAYLFNYSLFRYIKNPNYELQLLAVSNRSTQFDDKEDLPIQFIENPSDEIILAAANINSRSLLCVKNLSEDLQMKIVQKQIFDIDHILHPTHKIMQYAIDNGLHLISYIHNPTDDIAMQAVKKCGSDIIYIDNPSEELQMEAVSGKEFAFLFIDHPTEKVIEYVLNDKRRELIFD